LLSEKAKALLKNRPPLQLAISKQNIFVHSLIFIKLKNNVPKRTYLILALYVCRLYVHM
jgi:hypothetical protein